MKKFLSKVILRNLALLLLIIACLNSFSQQFEPPNPELYDTKLSYYETTTLKYDMDIETLTELTTIEKIKYRTFNESKLVNKY